MTDTLRKTDFETLLATLDEQQARKVDVILPATALCSGEGNLRVLRSDLEPELTADGVKSPVEVYAPNEVFDEGLCDRLRNGGVGIPRAFLRNLREQGWTDMIDGTVNALIHGKRMPGDPADAWLRQPIDKRVMLRALKDADGGPVGTARALLSNSYKIVDHVETLRAAMRGMAAAGLGAENIAQCDLTGRRMYVTVVAPEIKALAPELLKGYRSPFTGETGAENPTVFAGFVLSNSETGHGSFTVTPRLTVQVCTNGMTLSRDAVSARHLGAKLDDGVINYSDRTRRANLELITSQAEDAVRTFLDVDYMKSVITEMTEAATAEIKGDVEKRIKEVTQKIEAPALFDDVLSMFIKGGDLTQGGIVQAVTAAAQSADIDADLAFQMESKATALLLR